MNTLAMHPADAMRIGTSCFSFASEDGRTVYFSNLEPFDCHDENDRAAMLLRIAKFAKHGIGQRDLQAAFGVGRATVQRAVRKLRDQGEAAFHEARRGRGTSAIVGQTAHEAQRLLASGMRIAAVARELGVASSTLYDNCAKGFIGDGERRPGGAKHEKLPEAGIAKHEAREQPQTEGTVADARENLLDRSERDRRDRAARDSAGRVAASAGAMDEARPCFDEPLSAVACGGVLAALPTLLKEGLLEHAGAFLSLPKGYYGLTSTLLLLAFLFMARVRNPEALRHEAPGEWGAVLGLDRCPEAKTLRRKIRALAADVEKVKGWQDALAQTWMADAGDTVATLSVDGHVKVYAGRKGRLPKHFVSRQKLCLPASTSYWVNALGGRPLLCLHKALDPTMTHALEHDVLPALERLGLPGPDAPDLVASPQGAPALTLVFDREGWSPALFARLARRGIAVITWHKGFRGADWPEEEFRAVQAPLHGPGGAGCAEVRLAERRVGLNGGPEVRQIRRLLDTGRQVPLVTTDFTMPMEKAAGALFWRWAQENFFRYMREEFNLDALPVHALAEQEPQARVVNPARRELDRRINRLRNRLGTLRNRVADLLRGTPSDTAAKSAGKLKAQIGTLDVEREALKARRNELPTHVKVAELGEDEMLDALPSRERLLLDVIRMIAYRAETTMMPAVAQAQGGKQRPRRPLAELFRSEADIVPDPENAILRVRILGTASDAGDAAIAGLLDELNHTRTIFPGTGLRLVYELPKVAPNPRTKGSQSL